MKNAFIIIAICVLAVVVIVPLANKFAKPRPTYGNTTLPNVADREHQRQVFVRTQKLHSSDPIAEIRSLLNGTICELWQINKPNTSTPNSQMYFFLALGGQPMRVLGLGVCQLEGSFFLVPSEPYLSKDVDKMDYRLVNCNVTGTSTDWTTLHFDFNLNYSSDQFRHFITAYEYSHLYAKIGNDVTGVVQIRDFDLERAKERKRVQIAPRMVKVWPQ